MFMIAVSMASWFSSLDALAASKTTTSLSISLLKTYTRKVLVLDFMNGCSKHSDTTRSLGPKYLKRELKVHPMREFKDFNQYSTHVSVVKKE